MTQQYGAEENPAFLKLFMSTWPTLIEVLFLKKKTDEGIDEESLFCLSDGQIQRLFGKIGPEAKFKKALQALQVKLCNVFFFFYSGQVKLCFIDLFKHFLHNYIVLFLSFFFFLIPFDNWMINKVFFISFSIDTQRIKMRQIR